MRTNIGPLASFYGLNLKGSKFLNDANYAIEALDCIIVNGKIEARPGRIEISEAQVVVNPILGGQVYFPVNGERKIILVRKDGIFQRTE